MTNDEKGIDFDSLKGILEPDQIASMWAKAEIAKILSKRSIELMEEIHTELRFYMITQGIKEE